MRLGDFDNFSDKFNSEVFNKLQNDYLNSSADNKTKEVADFVVTEIMVIFNNLIDNAPTVEYTFEEAFQKTVCEQRLYCPQRPQGEWIEEGTEIGALGIKYTRNKCNKCGWSSSLVLPRNYCPSCGADMRGAKNDNSNAL